LFDAPGLSGIISADPLMKSIVTALLLAAAAASAATVGYVSIETDSLPNQVYFDATSVPMSVAPVVVEATPGKHFVSLFQPKKVYQAASGEAPEQFWDKLRKLGAIPDQPGLLSSYEAGSVRVGTDWVYVTPEDTVKVKLSHADVMKTYRRDSNCVMGTFIGWTLAVGAAMILSIIFARINS
jgi:hypothetical protein